MGKNSVAKARAKAAAAAQRQKLTNGVSSDESDDEVGENSGGHELSEYEKKRLENVRRNNALLAELNLTQIKEEFSEVAGKRKPVSAKGLPRAKKLKQEENLPPRQSLRIRRIDPAGNSLPDLPPPWSPEPVDEHKIIRYFRKSVKALGLKDMKKFTTPHHAPTDCPRKPSGPLEMAPVNEVEEQDSKAFLDGVSSSCSAKVSHTSNKVVTAKVTLTELDPERYEKSLASLEIKETHVAKVVPQRIFSMAIHPSLDKTVIFAGDKWGRLGIWDVGSSGGNDGVYLYEPHSRPVTCMAFAPEDWGKLYTSSYDGTMRCADLGKAVFNEVYACDEDDYTRIISFSCGSSSSNTILAGQSDGTVMVVDTRTGKSQSTADSWYQLHDKTIKCVHVHPLNPNIFLTSSTDCTVALWDLRKIKNMKSKLGTVNRNRTVTSAYFSPLTGKQIVATSMDHYLTVCEVEPSGVPSKTPKCAFRHLNDTGRWLSQFRATWDPKSDSYFVVGSMRQPRQIDIFSSEKKGGAAMHLVHENLNSINSLNVFHPTHNILAGGNSSGKVYLWTH